MAKAKKAPEYPKPKRGERVACLGCKKGVVLVNGVKRPCRACEGEGFFVAK